MWKTIKDFDKYQVNERGEVLNTHTGKLVAVVFYSSGRYPGVALQQNGRRKDIKIHQLLGEYFLEKPAGAQVIDHLNKDSRDNRLDNLKWVTHEENCRNRSHTKLSQKQADEIRERLLKGERVTYLAKEFGVTHSLISAMKKQLMENR